MRQHKGITLIALVITIIIMLILAGVSIGLVFNGGLINYAKIARTETKRQIQDEKLQMLQAEYEMAKLTNETEALNLDDYILRKKYGIKIGDIVTYDEEYNTWIADISKGVGGEVEGGFVGPERLLQGDEYETENLEWRVLGVNSEGQIELISAEPTSRLLFIQGDTGTVHGVPELNNFCDELYGQGIGAEGARSVTIEDINKLTGFKKENYLKETRDGDSFPYGQEWKYKFDEGYGYYSTDEGKNWNICESPFIEYFDNQNRFQQLLEGEEIELTDTYYDYDILKSELGADNTIEEIISNYDEEVPSYEFWLASHYIECEKHGPGYGLRCVVGARMGCGTVSAFSLSNNMDVPGLPVRPVVTLSANVQLEKNLENKWIILDTEELIN